jgi:hypothetical protein
MPQWAHVVSGSLAARNHTGAQCSCSDRLRSPSATVEAIA